MVVFNLIRFYFAKAINRKDFFLLTAKKLRIDVKLYEKPSKNVVGFQKRFTYNINYYIILKTRACVHMRVRDVCFHRQRFCDQSNRVKTLKQQKNE